MTIFHITNQRQWQLAQAQGFYTTESLMQEGFIHGSTAAQVPTVLAAFYQGKTDLVLLEIEPTLLEAELKWEAPVHPSGQSTDTIADTEKFPHIYGTINLNAVIRVHDLSPSYPV
ncbi:MAG: DUF952 domain-containing protein [Snowella sp.]|nr:DUF952 domain-containing protein [Snowella sp.]